MFFFGKANASGWVLGEFNGSGVPDVRWPWFLDSKCTTRIAFCVLTTRNAQQLSSFKKGISMEKHPSQTTQSETCWEFTHVARGYSSTTAQMMTSLSGTSGWVHLSTLVMAANHVITMASTQLKQLLVDTGCMLPVGLEHLIRFCKCELKLNFWLFEGWFWSGDGSELRRLDAFFWLRHANILELRKFPAW